MSIVERFSRLNPDQQRLLELHALAYLPLRIDEAVDLLNNLNIRRSNGRRFTVDHLRIEALDLLREGILQGDPLQASLQEDWYEVLTRRMSHRDDFQRFLEQVRTALGIEEAQTWADTRHLMRDIRFAFYADQEAEYQRLVQRARVQYPISYASGEFSRRLYRDFDAGWLLTQSIERQNQTLRTYFPRLLSSLDNVSELRVFLANHRLLDDPLAVDLRHTQHLLMLFSGHWKADQAVIMAEVQPDRRGFRMSAYSFALGQYELAARQFEEALSQHRQLTSVSNGFPGDESGVFFLMGLLRNIHAGLGKSLQDWLKNVPDGPFPVAFESLRILADFLNQQETAAQLKILDIFGKPDLNAVEWLTLLLVSYWIEAEPDENSLDRADEFCRLLWEVGFFWLAHEMSLVLAEMHPDGHVRATHRELAQEGKPEGAGPPLRKLFPRREPWQRTLDALLSMGNGKRAVRGKRLVWYVDFDRQELEVKEQTEKHSGGWTTGRRVPLKQLREGALDRMLPQDIEAGKAVRNRYGARYSYNEYDLELDFGRAMLALAGHPHLYLLQNRKVPVEIIATQARLLIEETGLGFELRFNYPIQEMGIQLIKETPTRFLVMRISEKQAQMGRVLGDGFLAPAEARERIEEMSRRLSGYVDVQKAIGEEGRQLERKPGDPRPCLHLLPLEEGFKLEFFVKPLTDRPPYRKPGQGSTRLSIETENGPIVCVRNPAAEVSAAKAILAKCPILAALDHLNYEWLISDNEQCLQVLSELYPLRTAGLLTLEHPKGEKIRLNTIVGLSSLRLRVKKDHDWFAVSGELVINENQVMDFQDLLRRVNESDSDFVELNDEQYLALTDELRMQIRGIGGMLHEQHGQLFIPELAALQLEDLSDQLAEFEADEAWRQTLAKMHSLADFKAELPSAMQVDMRPYQLEGYEWLMRLAEWGVGACLADDMGLGKTVQALAAILARSDRGPSLVVAPASVTRNWERETYKFCPTLNPILLGPGDRQQIINALGPGDLLLVSYGLLPFIGEELEQCRFATAVLDEAQAIKNRATKRSKAAMALQADFRIATTGTPIENHLGELWNLFRYLNPGLLGSHRHFNEKFAMPIARMDDRARREQLRKLIQPFVLRRRKEEVLKDLPPKTEVTLNVELSMEERAFYEAIRRQALETISRANGTAERFTVLAQLTKLRQAACHPKMVDPSSRLGSAKLELVASTIEEILETGHKALVFSQFVKHLRLVENWVKKAGIPYQYLDGQTPGAKRDEAVQAFQSGEGQLFLISLKAGGTGLNLTEADYVLHLDPWWNPAVEDQASDRAHRIGQQRPVTVYRFVTEDTIEEKIVNLHHEKRDLADSLLAGTETSASLSVSDMLELIKEGSTV